MTQAHALARVSRADAQSSRDNSPGSLQKAHQEAPTGQRNTYTPRSADNVNRLSRLRRRLLLSRDLRGRLPPWISRFLGYRHPDLQPPYPPLAIFPFNRLGFIPLKYEVWLFGWIGSFIGILLIESIMSTHTAFREIYHAPIIFASFGATAVLVFGTIDSPLSQPRNVIGGHLVSAIIGVAITRLFARDASYAGNLENEGFHAGVLLNGAISMSIALLAMFITGTSHPPGGATALIAAVEPVAVRMSWRYVPTILVSALVISGWALVINNLGRRRWPVYWWKPQRCFVKDEGEGGGEDEEIAIASGREGPLRVAEDGGRTEEALRMERLSGWGGSEGDLERALSRASSRAGGAHGDKEIGRSHFGV